METCQVVYYEEYVRLLWWAVIGYKKIMAGEDPKKTAQRHLEGLEQMVRAVEEYEIKLKKSQKKTRKPLTKC